MKISVDESKCIGCGVCEGICPECFKIEEGVATVIKDDCADCDFEEVAQSCPVEAIIVEK